MRLDLFLKTCRLVKRRIAAQELCAGGSILVNGQAAKPARSVRAGDHITLRFPSRTIEVEILYIPLSAKRPVSAPTIRVLNDIRVSQDVSG